MVSKKGQAPRVEFSQGLFDRICALIADGKSVRQIAELDGMPDRATFNKWRKRTPELQAQYDQAFKDYEDSVLEDIVYISDTEKDAAIARNRMDARKWELRIRNRKRFGDKLGLDGGEDGSPLVVKIVRHGDEDA